MQLAQRRRPHRPAHGAAAIPGRSPSPGREAEAHAMGYADARAHAAAPTLGHAARWREAKQGEQQQQQLILFTEIYYCFTAEYICLGWFF